MNEQFSVFTTGLPVLPFFQEMAHILIRSVESAERLHVCVFDIYYIYSVA